MGGGCGKAPRIAVTTPSMCSNTSTEVNRSTAIALCSDESIASRVAPQCVVGEVCAAIDFDDEPRRVRRKVGVVRAERHLPPKVVWPQQRIAKRHPEPRLRRRHAAAE